MEAFIHARTKWVFAATQILAGLLIGGYAAMVTEQSPETAGQAGSGASVSVWPQPSDLDAEFENENDSARRREFLDRFSGVGPGGVSPEDFAEAWVSARA